MGNVSFSEIFVHSNKNFTEIRENACDEMIRIIFIGPRNIYKIIDANVMKRKQLIGCKNCDRSVIIPLLPWQPKCTIIWSTSFREHECYVNAA